MPPPVRPGQYRHQPGTEMRMTADGRLMPSQTRRRFPYAGLVLVVSAALGTLACAGASLLLNVTLGNGLARITGKTLPPAPSFQNVLFGAGLPEVALACGLAGYWLWCLLWKTRLPERATPRTAGQNARELLLSALVLAPVLTFLVACIGIVGLYVRTAPSDQPVAVRPFFGLLAVPALGGSAMYTGIIPLVLALLGLLLGAVGALAVGYFWTQFPEEPKYK